MANYNTISEMLEAGVTNATAIRNNSYNDSGTDTFTGVDWFTFHGVTASTIYASGNTWFGFGTNTNQLNVDYRDAASYYVYREEGILAGAFKFLKMRWSGRAHYSNNSYWITYDVILWETGDISLHMIQIPTSYNNGTYSLVDGTTYNYTVSNEFPDVTFYRTDNGWVVKNELIFLEGRFLIRSNGSLYDVQGNILASQTLSAQTFRDYGSFAYPETATLLNFTNPEVLYFIDDDDAEPKLVCTESASPFPQILYSPDYDLTDFSITGIEDADIIASDDILFAISTDQGVTWKAHNGTQWITLSSENSGMSGATFESISLEDWALIYSNATQIRVRAVIPAITSYIESVIINFLN